MDLIQTTLILVLLQACLSSARVFEHSNNIIIHNSKDVTSDRIENFTF